MSPQVEDLHDEWLVVSARTAKCDLCHLKNKGGMQRCKRCTVHCCNKCFEKLPNNGAHKRGGLGILDQTSPIPDLNGPSSSMRAQGTNLISALKPEREARAARQERTGACNNDLLIRDSNVVLIRHETSRNKQSSTTETEILQDNKKRKMCEPATEGGRQKNSELEAVIGSNQRLMVTRTKARARSLEQSNERWEDQYLDYILFVASIGKIPDETFINLTSDERACFLRAGFDATHNISDSETEDESKERAQSPLVMSHDDMDVVSQIIEPMINYSTQDDSGAKLSDVQVGTNLRSEEVNICHNEHTGAGLSSMPSATDQGQAKDPRSNSSFGR